MYANAQGEVSENTALADLQAAVTVGQKVVPVFSSAQPDVPHRPKKVTKVYETIKEDPEEFEEEEMPGDSGTGVVPAGEPKSYELSVSSQRPRMTRKKSVAIQPQQESSSFAGAVSRVAAEITAHDINGHQRHSVVEQAAIVQDITREVSYRPAEPDYRRKFLSHCCAVMIQF